VPTACYVQSTPGSSKNLKSQVIFIEFAEETKQIKPSLTRLRSLIYSASMSPQIIGSLSSKLIGSSMSIAEKLRRRRYGRKGGEKDQCPWPSFPHALG
jgi:hypothetical protein